MNSPIVLPHEFRTAIINKQSRLADLQRMILDAGVDCPVGTTQDCRQSPLGTVITRSFLDWLVTSGRAQHVLDLICLDKKL